MRTVVLFTALFFIGSIGALAGAADPPATRPAGPLDGIDAALKMVPSGVLPAKAEGWTVAKRDVANDALDQKVKGQRLKIRIKISAVAKDGDDYVIAAENAQMNTFTTATDVHFPKDSALDVARLTVGDEITVIGEVSMMSFGDQMPVPELDCILLNCTIVKDRPARR